ncbi:lipoprotein signal peptidase [Sulfobacillus acidophilus TPY]|uniref:Lipoprotein signal peptidase n=1 Tax=Sulfobacillus acidophilus (strain ATCC 700253 / DSM 10332 / NAL) TaxID=679936 RepID=G8TX49_SULAD|nr:lipoprotein signal peptidase [Sulfobacillus acidophilus TPY]AEW04957.1 signal peptidase II [Sulfobacillus acidophilus DSM 10332]
MARRWVVALMAGIFLIDRVIKDWIQSHMQIGQSIPVLPPVLWITYITNNGAAFSLFRHAVPMFIAIAVIILGAVGWYLASRPRVPRIQGWGIGLLSGGTAGNLWDRVWHGRVIDYIHFRFWAIFNIADAAIVIGIGLLMWDYWRRDEEEHHGA